MEVEEVERVIYKFQPYVFQLEAPMSRERPQARSGHRIVCTEKYMYSIGGFNPCIPDDDPEMSKDEVWMQTKPLFRELWRFNLSSRKWKRMPGQKTLPMELASTAVLKQDNNLIIFGGTGVPFGDSCSNKLHICNLNDGLTTQLSATGALPDPQYGQALIRHDHYLYTVGGTTGYDYTCDIHRFDFRTGVWEDVYICSGIDAIEPGGRYRHELAYDGKMIYVLGGGTGRVVFGFLHIPAFDLVINQWRILQTIPDNLGYPMPRRCHGAVQMTDEHTGHVRAFIYGGYAEEGVFYDMWRLDLETLQWKCFERLPQPNPVFFHSVALTPLGKMYTFGGVVGEIAEEAVRTNAVHGVWLKIPSLAEISWEAVKFYYNLRDKSRKELFHMGVPMHFIDRLED